MGSPHGLDVFRKNKLTMFGAHCPVNSLTQLAESKVKKVYKNPRIHVEVLERKQTASSPKHVLEQLDEFRKNYKIKIDYDELWLVLDVDRWGEEKLAEICRLALQKYYQLAISNPCFELWLLLHHRSLDEYSPETLVELRDNKKEGTHRTRLERELFTILGRYNKFNLQTEDFIPHICTAIQRAKTIDIHPEERWPNSLGTQVYRLAIRLIGDNFSK